jgi:hypothetical protein
VQNARFSVTRHGHRVDEWADHKADTCVQVCPEPLDVPGVAAVRCKSDEGLREAEVRGEIRLEVGDFADPVTREADHQDARESQSA